MKILRQISGAAGIFFPIGLPPEGTCKFATETCLAKCIALKDKEDGKGLRVSQDVKKNIHNFFITKPSIEVCFKIIQEMGQMHVNILHWFMSGDCLPEDEKRIVNIIETLWKNTGVVQVGFTRNEDFWNNIRHRSNIVLTCESKMGTFGDRFSTKDNYGRIYGVPDYTGDIVELYIVDKSSGVSRCGACGSQFVGYDYYGVRTKDVRPVNCAQCLKSKEGCFYKQSIRSKLRKGK